MRVRRTGRCSAATHGECLLRRAESDWDGVAGRAPRHRGIELAELAGRRQKRRAEHDLEQPAAASRAAEKSSGGRSCRTTMSSHRRSRAPRSSERRRRRAPRTRTAPVCGCGGARRRRCGRPGGRAGDERVAKWGRGREGCGGAGEHGENDRLQRARRGDPAVVSGEGPFSPTASRRPHSRSWTPYRARSASAPRPSSRPAGSAGAARVVGRSLPPTAPRPADATDGSGTCSGMKNATGSVREAADRSGRRIELHRRRAGAIVEPTRLSSSAPSRTDALSHGRPSAGTDQRHFQPQPHVPAADRQVGIERHRARPAVRQPCAIGQQLAAEARDERGVHQREREPGLTGASRGLPDLGQETPAGRARAGSRRQEQ